VHHREIILKHYPAYISWLNTQEKAHRYFLYWYEIFNNSLPDKGVTEDDKINIIATLNMKLDAIMHMTNKEYDNFLKTNHCQLGILWHDKSEDTRRLFGDLLVDDILIENEDGSEAEKHKCIFELIDGEWVFLGEIEDEVR